MAHDAGSTGAAVASGPRGRRLDDRSPLRGWRRPRRALPEPPAPATRRVTSLVVESVGAALALTLALTGVGSAPRLAATPLYAEGIAVRPDGSRTDVPTGTTPTYLPGSRVLAPATPDAASDSAAAADRAWLASGTVPGAAGPYGSMVTDALLDMHALVLAHGAAVASWTTQWRYVWPRDAAFVAVALARTGHVSDALSVLDYLDTVQSPDGSFEARYLPDASGPPDGRGVQTDGTGWALWATGEVMATIADPTARTAATTRLSAMIERSTTHLLTLVAGDGLPPASSDYWEVRERRLTLGTVAPVIAGLRESVELLAALGADDLAQRASVATNATAVAVVDAFGPGGYGRYADRSHADADAASAFLLPPFVETALPGAEAAWRASAAHMARPAGGLAPGEAWRQDGVSWTPETSLYALVAATIGDDQLAGTWLTWLDAHRTLAGSIPEKVLADGSPAAVAPLAWSAACVVLAVGELDTH